MYDSLFNSYPSYNGYQEGYWCWTRQRCCPYADRMTGNCMSNALYEQCNGHLEYSTGTTYDGTCPYTIMLEDEIKKEIL